MLRRIFLPVIAVILGYGFWVSGDFSEIAAGVALFLFGMLGMEQGFRLFSGGSLQRLLNHTTDRLWKSLGFGLVSTTVMQSSSLVSVITISFLSAEMISLAQGIGIVFGANLGTTTGAWIVAGFGLKVKISAYAMPMLVFGVLLLMQASNRVKGAGWILVGIGFLFLGIAYMKEGFSAFTATLDLAQYAMTGVLGLLLFTGIGVLATVVMQSSHATLALTITALAAGQLTYENALALAIGANIGTTITAVLGALGATISGKRLAAAHLIFNGVTGLLALLMIRPLAAAVDWISAGIGIAPQDYTLKLAVFHTLFNLMGVVLMVPFIQSMVRVLEKYMTGVSVEHDEPRYLSAASLELPDVALGAVYKETLHLFDNAFSLVAHGVDLKRSTIRGEQDLQALLEAPAQLIDIDLDDQYGRMIKSIYSANIEFISRAQVLASADYRERFAALRDANLEIVAAIKATKHLRKNLHSHLRSNNRDIRREYNRFRARIGSVLRQVSQLAEEDEPVVTLLALDRIRVEEMDAASNANEAVDRLIRVGTISSSIATSLINDGAYTRELVGHLLAVTESLTRANLAEGEVLDSEMTLHIDEIADIARGSEGVDLARLKEEPR
ncbi:MAG: Na/Pi symporter [Halieaceae bacterium]